MKRIQSASLTKLCAFLALGVLMSACGGGSDDAPQATAKASKPTANPYLSSSLYSITHFDSSASDSTPYGPPRGEFVADLSTVAVSAGGPVNIMTLAATDPNYMWHVGSDRIEYVSKKDGAWTPVARYEALEATSGGVLPAIPDAQFVAFGKSSAVGQTVASMDAALKGYFGDNYASRFGNGIYALADNRNVVYAAYGGSIYGVTLKDPAHPEAGLEVRYRLPNVVKTIQGPDAVAGLLGFAMTYDGHLIVTFSNGIAVIDRDLTLSVNQFYPFSVVDPRLGKEAVTNSLSVDENNGIYVASNLVMRKLVWTGTRISDAESDGAWSSPYDNSGLDYPPIIKAMNGTGSTPTLMGFGNDADKLVVITDGSKRMKLVAFWRDKIPQGSTSRIAGQIQVTCGFSTPPEWIQSEQSVVVNGYGAFVVNNIPQTVAPELKTANTLVKLALMGPSYQTAWGVERFQWDSTKHQWSSAWARPDVSSTSMIPIYSESGNMALINGYRSEWEVLGLDWDTGKTVHRTSFGNANFGNGAYAILQFLENQDLLFNSYAGIVRLHYK